MAQLMRLMIASGLLVIAGCAGGEGSDDAMRPTTFTTRANAICLKYGRAVDRYERSAPAGPDVAMALHRVFEAARKETDALRALTPPNDVEEAFNELLERHEKRDRLLAQLSLFAENHPEVVTQRVNRQWEDTDADVVTLAARTGLRACAATSLDLNTQ